MVAEAIHHYRARAEAARQLSAGRPPAEIVRHLEATGVPVRAAHEALHEAQRAIVHAPVDRALRSALAGGFWFVAGLGVLLLTYGLGRRIGEDLMVGVVLIYGLAVMAVGLLRAFRAGDERDRSSVFRLFVMALLLVLVAGGFAVKAYQRQAAHAATVGTISAHLETIRSFNQEEGVLARRLATAGDGVTEGLAALRELTPSLAAYAGPFASMAEQARVHVAEEDSRDGVLVTAFGELASLYAAEASLYADLRDAAAAEPPSAAWLGAMPILKALDRSYGRIDLHSRALEGQLEASAR